MTAKNIRNVAAIMVVYAPPQQVREAIARTLAQVDWLIIIDNADNADLREWVAAHHPQAQWLHNPENGLGKAQNLGIEKAQESGAEWILLLDDDSLPAPDMITNMQAAYGAMPSKQRATLGVLGAHIQEAELHRPALYIQPWLGVLFRRVGFGHTNQSYNVIARLVRAIHKSRIDTPHKAEYDVPDGESKQTLHNLLYTCASGSLIPMRVIADIGAMEAAFFIYFIDTEFCLRARQHGYDIVAVENAVLHHRIGKRSTHTLFGRTFSTTNHPPPAREWLFRNRIILWKRYLLKQPAFVLFDITRATSEIMRITLFEQNRIAKLKAILRGIITR